MIRPSVALHNDAHKANSLNADERRRLFAATAAFRQASQMVVALDRYL